MAESATVTAVLALETACQTDENTFHSQNFHKVNDNSTMNLINCLKHSHREVSLFCRTCDKFVCTSCIVDGNHSNHKLCEISNVAEEKQIQLKNEVSSRGKEICEKVQDSITVMEQEKNSVKVKCKTESEKVAEQKKSIVQEIERWSENLQTMVKNYQDMKVDNLNNHLVQSNTCLSLLKVFQQDPESVYTTDSTKSIQILDIIHAITDPTKTQEDDTWSFLPGSGLCEEKLPTLFGRLVGLPWEMSASDTTGNIIPTGNSVCVDKDEAVESDQDSTDNESLYEDAIGSETLYKCGNSAIDRIAPIDGNGAFIVTEKKLYIINFSKHKRDMKKEKPLMTNVIHITPVTEEGIYVQQARCDVVTRVTTTGKKYRFVECAKGTLRCVGLSKSIQVIIYTENSSLELDKIGYTKLLITHDFSSYDQNGTLIKSLLTCKLSPSSIFKSHVSDIVMTMSAMYILDSSLNIPDKPFAKGHVDNILKDISYTGAIGKDPSSQFHPRGMCQDKDGCLIITDYWNHALHLLTPEGKFSKFLMREEDGLTHPTAVALDNYRYLWIGQHDGTVHIIKYNP